MIQTTLQKHAVEVENLTQTVYGNLSEKHQMDMGLDILCGTLGDKATYSQ